MQYKTTVGFDGWTRSFESKKFHEHIPGTPYPAFGAALLFYKHERRLSVSIWGRNFSRNFRIWGPRLLSWQKKL